MTSVKDDKYKACNFRTPDFITGEGKGYAMEMIRKRITH